MSYRKFTVPSVDAGQTTESYEFSAPSFGEIHQFKITVPNSIVNLGVGIKPDFVVGTNDEVLRVINVDGGYDESDIHAFYVSSAISPEQALTSLWIRVENIGDEATGPMNVELIVFDY